MQLSDLQGKKIGIDFYLRHLPSSGYSHVTSWAALRCNQLKNLGLDVELVDCKNNPEHLHDGWAKYDMIILYQDMAMQQFIDKLKILNVYDVIYEPALWFFQRIIWDKYKHIEFVSLDWPMLDYGYRCGVKVGAPKTHDSWNKTDWSLVTKKCQSMTNWIKDPCYEFSEGKKHFVVGDSHAHSVYTPHSVVIRKDGRTMSGILKKGIKNEIIDQGFDFNQVASLTTYYGSIDIRHHLCREEDPIKATKTLLKKYEDELKSLNLPIEVAVPLPIEDESRPIPNTGKYKGTGFYGSREQRIEVLNCFRDCLHDMSQRNSWNIFEWPKMWYNIGGVEFMNMMEKPRSVHLAWKNYRWDLINNIPNPSHKTSSLLEF